MATSSSLSAHLGWGDTGWSSSSQPIPTGRRFEQIFMLRDLPNVHADGGGDLFEIRLLVCGHRNAASGTESEQPNQAKLEARHYINELRPASKLCPLTAKTGVRVP